MNKIINGFGLAITCMVVFMLDVHLVTAQVAELNKYGLYVINQPSQFLKSVQGNPEKDMVDVKKEIPGIQLDLKYAGVDNFTHTKLYPPIATAYLRKKAVDALATVQKELNKMGLGLKLFDAYRPYSITELMWNMVKDERYAADPKKGSGHNRGIAVDLTVINLNNYSELDMGTAFDSFSDSAHYTYRNLPDTVLQNRKLLADLMEQYGFNVLDTEWWHFYLRNSENFEIIDLDFNQLQKLKNN